MEGQFEKKITNTRNKEKNMDSSKWPILIRHWCACKQISYREQMFIFRPCKEKN